MKPVHLGMNCHKLGLETTALSHAPVYPCPIALWLSGITKHHPVGWKRPQELQEPISDSMETHKDTTMGTGENKWESTNEGRNKHLGYFKSLQPPPL